jgi:hypothetical protein
VAAQEVTDADPHSQEGPQHRRTDDVEGLLELRRGLPPQQAQLANHLSSFSSSAHPVKAFWGSRRNLEAVYLFVWMSGRQFWRLLKLAMGVILVLALAGWLLHGLGIGNDSTNAPTIPLPAASFWNLSPSDPRYCQELNNHVATPGLQQDWDNNCMNNPNFDPATNKYTNGS